MNVHRTLGRCVASLLALAATAAAGEAVILVENGSSALAGNGMSAAIDTAEKKIGLAAARIDYDMRDGRRAELRFNRPRRLAGPGRLRLWLHGDGSGNRLVLRAQHARLEQRANGEVVRHEQRDEDLPGVLLDFTGWREVEVDARKLPKDRACSWIGLRIEEAGGKEAKRSGTIRLDDVRLLGAASGDGASLDAGISGTTPRIGVEGLALWVDLRNPGSRPLKARLRLALSDRNDAAAAGADREIIAGPGESVEVSVPLAVDPTAALSPPFRLRGDIICPDIPDGTVRFDESIAAGNGRLVADAFATVAGAWLPRPAPRGKEHEIAINQAFRFTADVQSALRAERGDIAPPPAEAGKDGWPAPGHSLRVAFSDEGTVWNHRPPLERGLPGDAMRIAFWVKGDGSGASVEALVCDFSDMAGYWNGQSNAADGWKRLQARLRLATLDFTGWRRIELDLPGGGIGTRLPRGSTWDVDYPLEVAGFCIKPAQDEGKRSRPGVVEIGPIEVLTQRRPSEQIGLTLGSTDDQHGWEAGKRCFVLVQNGALAGSRPLELAWTLSDRDGKRLLAGGGRHDLPAGELRRLPLDLGAAKLDGAVGPFTLTASLSDVSDPSAMVERALVLSRPDSRGPVADFEEERTYGALSARDTAGPTSDVGITSTAQAHSGRRSLAIAWNAQDERRYVSLDPPLPGIPVRLSFWLHGDGSGVQVAPMIGDQVGISSGMNHSQWDILPLRVVGSPVPELLTVDWTGWREVICELPPIPSGYADTAAVLPFVPSYPLGLHLAILGKQAKAASGTLHLDDLAVETHLPPAQRTGMVLEAPGGGNVLAPGGEVAAWLWNLDRVPRKVRLESALRDWSGATRNPAKRELELAPGERRRETLAADVPAGAWALRARLDEAGEERGRIDAELLAADLAPLLGDDWKDDLREPWRLRRAVQSHFEVVAEDWDWVEHHPGSLQAMTARDLLATARAADAQPWMLLGYCAFWAGGEGFAARQAGSYWRRQRDIGHAVDIFMAPEKDADWDAYVSGLMRAIGDEAAGWYLWDGPDSHGGLGVKPERFARLLAIADRWRRIASPKRPLVIGGMNRDSAIPWLQELAKADAKALERLDGVHLRLDVGRLPPEDAQVVRFADQLNAALGGSAGKPKRILFTDLDWAVEKSEGGLGPFDQAAYLARASLLLDDRDIHPAPALAIGDLLRTGLGLVWRGTLNCPPYTTRSPVLQVKPAWLALARMHRRLDGFNPTPARELPDRRPGASWFQLWRAADGRQLALAWRNDDAGELSFAGAGVEPSAAEDLFGTPRVRSADGWWPIGRVPVLFTLDRAEPAALTRVQVRDPGAEPAWTQRVLAQIEPGAGAAGYRATGGTAEALAGERPDGVSPDGRGLRFAAGGSETLELAVPAGSGLVLRKEFLLGRDQHVAEVTVNGRPAGRWDLTRSEAELADGRREAIWLITADELAGTTTASITLTYAAGGNTARWTALSYRGGAFPLEAVGAIHADQNAARLRLGRNVVGAPLRIGDKALAGGLGAYARSLVEVPLAKRFKRFTAVVGLDAITEGKGSVVFEVHGDGKRLWSSGPMSGLDPAKPVQVDIGGVERLRLIVEDGGDGNRYDAADWGDAMLER